MEFLDFIWSSFMESKYLNSWTLPTKPVTFNYKTCDFYQSLTFAKPVFAQCPQKELLSILHIVPLGSDQCKIFVDIGVHEES